MRKILLLLFVVISLAACKNTWYVVPNQDVESDQKSDGVAYFLPKAVLNVNLEIEVSHFIPGPFSQFADSYLNIHNAEMQEKWFWNITNAEIKSVAEADADALFWLIPKGKSPNVQLGNNSVLCGINSNMEIEKVNNDSYFNDMTSHNPANIIYTDLNVKRNMYEVIDTTWRLVNRDSLVQRIPIYKSVEREKNWHHKAQDAADYIIKIRKRRFKLEAAIDEQQAEGDGVQIRIEKLEELEQNYLDLFIGKTVTETQYLNFRIVPESGQNKQKILLAYLDKGDATVLKKNIQASEIMLNIENSTALSLSQPEVENHKHVGLYTRVVGNSQCIITMDGEPIYKTSICIPQLGEIIRTSSKLISGESVIEVNPKTGILQSIK